MQVNKCVPRRQISVTQLLLEKKYNYNMHNVFDVLMLVTYTIYNIISFIVACIVALKIVMLNADNTATVKIIN